MKNNNFYCQNICGSEDFSIDEWNKTFLALEKTNLSEKEKDYILDPPQCKEQCFDCLAIVGKQRLKTQKSIKKPKPF